MVRMSFFNSAALAALALAAVSSAPAFAAEPDEAAGQVSVAAEPALEAPREWRQQRGDDGAGRQMRREARQAEGQAPVQAQDRDQVAPQWQARQAEMAQARQEARSEAAPQWQGRQGRTWQGGSDAGNGGGWQARAQEQQAQAQAQLQAQAQDQAQAQAQAQAQQEAQAQQQAQAGWGGRNRTYTDPQRSGQGGTDRLPQWQGQNRDHDRDHDQAHNHSRGGWHGQDRYRSGQNGGIGIIFGSQYGSQYGGQYDSRYGGQYGSQYGSQYQNRDRYRQSYNGGNYRQWNNDWRRDRRYDWQSNRYANRDLYRGGTYYSPYRNYSYSRLSIGIFIDSLFYNNRYWINDPGEYRLPAVYGPYRWVRYYDDVLLVDVYSGEVVDAIYGFFW